MPCHRLSIGTCCTTEVARCTTQPPVHIRHIPSECLGQWVAFHRKVRLSCPPISIRAYRKQQPLQRVLRSMFMNMFRIDFLHSMVSIGGVPRNVANLESTSARRAGLNRIMAVTLFSANATRNIPQIVGSSSSRLKLCAYSHRCCSIMIRPVVDSATLHGMSMGTRNETCCPCSLTVNTVLLCEWTVFCLPFVTLTCIFAKLDATKDVAASSRRGNLTTCGVVPERRRHRLRFPNWPAESLGAVFRREHRCQHS